MTDKTEEDSKSQSDFDAAESNAPLNASEDTPLVPDQQLDSKPAYAKSGKGAATPAETVIEEQEMTTPAPETEDALVFINAKSGSSTDRKEVSTMSNSDTTQKKLAELLQKKADLQAALAASAGLEQEVQRLQEADQLKARKDLADGEKEYQDKYKELSQRATDFQTALQRLTEKVKSSPKVTDAQIKQLEEISAKVDADIKAKEALVEKLTQEQEQLEKDVDSAKKDVDKRNSELALRTGRFANVNTPLATLESEVAKAEKEFKGDDLGQVLKAWSKVLQYKSTFDKDIKPNLVSPDDLQKDLEGKQKALDEALDKQRKLEVKLAEKTAERDAAVGARDTAKKSRDGTLSTFVQTMAGGAGG